MDNNSNILIDFNHPVENNSQSNLLLVILIISIGATIFWVDTLLHIGIAGGVPYVFFVVAGYWLRKPNATLLLAVVATALTWAGIYFSPNHELGDVVVISNRGLATFAIWTTAIFSYIAQKNKNTVSLTNSILDQEINKKTSELKSNVEQLRAKNEKLKKSQTALTNVMQDLHEEKQKLSNQILQRKNAEAQALESEERYRKIFENAGLGIAMINDQGVPYLVNDFFEKMFGYTREELSEKPFAEFTHPDDTEKDLEYYDRLIKGEISNYDMEKRYITKKGEIVWGALSVSLVDSQDSTYAIGMVQDITQRKQYEAELKDIKERFELVINGTNDGIWDQPNVNEDHEWWSPRFYELLGYDSNEIKASLKSFDKLLHPDDKPYTFKAVERNFTANEPFDVEYRLKTKSGKYNWFRARGHVSRDDQGKPIRMAGSISDIHEKKNAQKKLDKKNAELESINTLFNETQKFARIGPWEVKLETSEVYWTDQVYRIHEVPLGQKMDITKGINFYHPDYRSQIEEAVNQAVELQKPWDLELKLITAKGNEIWVRALGIPVIEDEKTIGLRGLFMDINRRKEAEEELVLLNDSLARKVKERTQKLQKTQSQYKDLYDNAPDMYVSVSAEDASVLECNKTFLKKTGFLKKEVIGKSVIDFYHSDSRDAAIKAFESFVSSGVVKNAELQLRKKDNERIDVSLNVSTIKDEHGKIIQSRSSWRDITNIKKADGQIKTLNGKLKKQVLELKDLNQELESFSYSVSHDLRAPLRVIDGFSRILLEDYEEVLDQEGKETVQTIVSNVDKMSELIASLLVFSRLSRKEIVKDKIDAKYLVNEVIEEIKQSIDFSNYKLEVDSDIPEIYGDRALIKQVFTNVISNAVKYSRNEEKPRIIIEAKKASGVVEFIITDNGVGFDMKYYDKLFGVFQRLHRHDEFEGTGVGMALSKRIIERHGGEMSAKSEVSKGAEFVFIIPMK